MLNRPLKDKITSKYRQMRPDHSIHNQQLSMNFSRVMQSMKRSLSSVKDYWGRSPSTKIILVNAGVYCMWKLIVIPEEFMVKHFTRERHNLQEKRYHTLLTHSVTHTGIFSLGIDILMLGLMGRAIQTNMGNKYVWWLYGMGALFGGVTHSVFQRPSPYIAPEGGPTSVITAYLTFLAMLNPHQPFFFFGFPIKAWVLVASLGAYSLLADPEKQSFSGISAGLLVFTMMRMRMI